MLNQIVLVGRLLHTPEIKTTENGKKYTEIVVAVNRPFKNIEGIYETDEIPFTLFNELATNTTEYCKVGDLIGVKGSVRIMNDKLTLVAEKVTFLSSKNTNERPLGEGEI